MASYPPEHHMLRDLGLVIERGPGEKRAILLPATPAVRNHAGWVRPGVFATMVDVVGGGLAAERIAPDWIATAELSVISRAPARVGPVSANARVLRAGKTTIVLEVDLRDEGDGTECGLATMTFVRIARPEQTRDLDASAQPDGAVRFDFALPGSGLSRPYHDEIGVRVAEGTRGVVDLARSDYTANSFGSLQGGVVATLAEAAAEAALSAAGGNAGAVPLAVADLAVHYLAQGPGGPYRAAAQVLRASVTGAVLRVEISDVGASRRMALATVHAVPRASA